MKKIKQGLCGCLMCGILLAGFSMPTFAKAYENFDFYNVQFDWGSGARTSYLEKTTDDEDAIINTLSGNGGIVSPQETFNAQLLKVENNLSVRVGHRWNISPYTRSAIYYDDPAAVEDTGIAMGLSTRVDDGTTIRVKGSWSPDTN